MPRNRRGGPAIRRGGRGFRVSVGESDPYALEIAALAPRHWYRADTVTLSGANLVSMPNRGTLAGAALLPVGTIPAPAPDAVFLGAPSIRCAGTHLAASPAASEFKFMSDGSGVEVLAVVDPEAVSGLRGFLSTFRSTAAPGFLMGVGNSPGDFRTRIYNDAGTPVYAQDNIGALTSGRPTLVHYSFKKSALVEARSGTDQHTSTGSLTPGVADPGAALRVGLNHQDLATTFGFVDLLIFDRLLTAYERHMVRLYLARYGVSVATPPTVELPLLRHAYSWIRADYYAEASGKATAFLDRAAPGHMFTQASASNQVAKPAASAAFGGRMTAQFSAAALNYYTSIAIPDAWGFIHRGSPGVTCAMIFRAVNPNTGTFLSNITSGPNPGFGALIVTDTELAVTANNDAGVSFAMARAGAGTIDTSPALVVYRYGESASPKVRLRRKGQQLFAGATSAAPGSGVPAATMQIGRRANGTGYSSIELADLLFYDRPISDDEVEELAAYASSYYELQP